MSFFEAKEIKCAESGISDELSSILDWNVFC
jgi:hypothetical protein